jgi:hypothetical protein
MMYMMTEQEHAQIVEALELVWEGRAQLETVPEALAMLKAMQPVSQEPVPLSEWEVLTEQNKMLLEALKKLTRYSECITQAFTTGNPYLDMTMLPVLCREARAAIAEAEKGATP